MLFSNINPTLYYVQSHQTSLNLSNDGPKHSTVNKLMFVSHGGCTVYFGSDKINLSKGDFFYIPPMFEYTTDIYGNFSNVNLYFSYTAQGNQPKTMLSRDWSTYLCYKYDKPALEKFEFDDYTVFNGPFALHDNFNGESIVKHIQREYERSLVLSDNYSSSLLNCLLVEIARHIGSSNQHYSSLTTDRIISYINENIECDINCASVGNALGYHQNYINAVIKAACGVCLHTYISNKKLERAVYLLENTDLSITEIAYQLSYSSSSRFSKICVNAMGVTPSSLRASLRERTKKPLL